MGGGIELTGNHRIRYQKIAFVMLMDVYEGYVDIDIHFQDELNELYINAGARGMPVYPGVENEQPLSRGAVLFGLDPCLEPTI